MKDSLNTKNLMKIVLINTGTVSLNKSTKIIDNLNFQLKGIKSEDSWRTYER